jgi:uncharacterized protein YeaO (DUF488 family)
MAATATARAPQLDVWTARVSYGGPDRLDVTRTAESPFAPSWDLLQSAKKWHMENEQAWERYRRRYTREMRHSWKFNRADWDNLLYREQLLGRGRVVLCCYCVDPKRCHRTILAGLLVAAGGDGVVYHGEIDG